MDNFLRAVAMHDGDDQALVYQFTDDTLSHQPTRVPAPKIADAFPGPAMLIDSPFATLVIHPGGSPEQLLDDVGRAWLFARRVERVAAEAAVVAIRHAHADGLTAREIAILLRCDIETVEETLALT